MSIKFFRISAHNLEKGEAELNQFIFTHKVIELEKHFVADGSNSYWMVCVTTTPAGTTQKINKSKRSSIDYKEILSPDDFKKFAMLRQLRKEISDAQGIPAYAVFTNEQLAKMVTERIASKAEMKTIEGIGESRIEKYADSFLVCLANDISSDKT